MTSYFATQLEIINNISQQNVSMTILKLEFDDY